jgi:site-specific DNA-methyltransferase (adenine-specific)
MSNIKNLINQIYHIDCREFMKELPPRIIDCTVTSPPYWRLRDYKLLKQEWDNGAWYGSLGLEKDFSLYIKHLCDVFDGLKRILKDSGTLWVNIGDTYNNSSPGSRDPDRWPKQSRNNHRCDKPIITYPRKSLCLIPERFVIEMVNRGWIIRNKIIWHKPNCFPSSQKDRFTVDFEELFLFVKSRHYYFKQQYEPQKESSIYRYNYSFGGVPGKAYPNEKRKKPYPDIWKPNIDGRIKRAVWKISARPFKGPHFAKFPEELVRTPILAGCPENGIVYDPFCGTGTTCAVAKNLGRNYIGNDLKKEYVDISKERIQ